MSLGLLVVGRVVLVIGDLSDCIGSVEQDFLMQIYLLFIILSSALDYFYLKYVLLSFDFMFISCSIVIILHRSSKQ